MIRRKRGAKRFIRPKCRAHRLYPPTTNWLKLPPEVMSTILLKLTTIEILTSVQHVCSSWYKICKQPHMWRVIDFQNYGDLDDMDYNLEIMCMHAAYRSRGQLRDISIEFFGNDNLLQYIVRRSKQQLRRLRLAECHSISNKGLTKAVSKLPLLEHLEIFLRSFSVKTLKTVGRCCPLLRSLHFNQQFCRGRRMVSDKKALAIAETMPKLRHLEIFGNSLTDRGLQAILDGCPDLEYLDLRYCFNLNLAGQLRQKCAERIKTLRLPHDPTTGDECCTLMISSSEDEDYY